MATLTARTFLTIDEQRALVQAIQQAERRTTGEIRVHLDDALPSRGPGSTPLGRAALLFEQLHMHETKARNGCLLYVAVKSQKVAVAGDVGINQRVSDGFWESTVAHITAHFREQRYATGLLEGIAMITDKLAELFPPEGQDDDELSNEISFEEGEPS